VNKKTAIARIKESLEQLADHIDGEWPLSEAFTDLDDHPDEDESGGFNHEVGYVRGLCEAFELDTLVLCDEVTSSRNASKGDG